MTEDTTPNETNRRKFLQTGASVAASALAVPVLSSTAVAHFPRTLDVEIKPGQDASPINPRSRGVVPVAVFRTAEFDPTTEDVRYRFGPPEVVSSGRGARPVHGGHVEDVDGDGDDDLVLHFPTRDAGFERGDSEARLVWERTEAGKHGLSGQDRVRTVGSGNGRR